MNVFRAKLSKDQLLSVPEPESSLFLTLGHLANEINALNKILLWATNHDARNTAEEHGQVTLQFLFLSLLAGKLKEAWELLAKGFFGSGISKEYEPRLRDDGKVALTAIKQYFGSSNLINDIRNQFAFHYSPDEIGSALAEVSEDLEIYVAKGGTANSLYYFAEVISANAMLKLLPELEPHIAYKRLVVELPRVAGWFAHVTDSLIVVFFEKYVAGIWDGVAEPVQFDQLPGLMDVSIPWFTDTTKAYEGLA